MHNGYEFLTAYSVAYPLDLIACLVFCSTVESLHVKSTIAFVALICVLILTYKYVFWQLFFLPIHPYIL